MSEETFHEKLFLVELQGVLRPVDVGCILFFERKDRRQPDPTPIAHDVGTKLNSAARRHACSQQFGDAGRDEHIGSDLWLFHLRGKAASSIVNSTHSPTYSLPLAGACVAVPQ